MVWLFGIIPILVPKNTGFGGVGGPGPGGGNKDSDISFAKPGKGESGGGLSGSKSERPAWQQKSNDLLATMEPSPTEDIPNNNSSTKNEGRLIYYSMIDDGGQPKIGVNARSLGVRTTGSRIDIHPDSNGNVRPQNKPDGMSVSPDDPMKAEEHRRPPEFGGTGKDPMWCMNTCDLPSDLNFKQDSPTHGVIEPAKDMSLDDYKKSLNSTQGFWRQVGRNNTGV